MIFREYHQSLSKHRMNDNRDSVKGSTHRKGTLATSRQTWFVVAKRSTDGAIANPNHRSLVPNEGGAPPDRFSSRALGTSAIASRALRATLTAQTAHNRANTPK